MLRSGYYTILLLLKAIWVQQLLKAIDITTNDSLSIESIERMQLVYILESLIRAIERLVSLIIYQYVYNLYRYLYRIFILDVLSTYYSQDTLIQRARLVGESASLDSRASTPRKPKTRKRGTSTPDPKSDSLAPLDPPSNLLLNPALPFPPLSSSAIADI